jgi:two-component system NtrC family sensor kinase
MIGYYRLSKNIVKPLQSLVKRAEEYREDDEMFFLYEKTGNEFNKLSNALNSMLKQIADDKEKLRTTVMSLEKANMDLKKAQKEIIQAEKLASVGRLSSGIAHEIGNPIGIVVGYLELLKQNDISDKDKKEFILRTENEINRVSAIIKQLLDFSRPSSEALEAVSVHSIIGETVDAFKFQPLMSDIELDLSFIAENDRVMADPNQLRQVFLNLLINAADAILSVKDHPKGKILITSEVELMAQAESADHLKMLKISYIDNGSGISKENLGNIFDPFYTTKEPGKGTGLGLSVCFMIIQGIGGKIQASSEEGKGSTINVYLPLTIQSPNGGKGKEKLDVNDG